MLNVYSTWNVYCCRHTTSGALGWCAWFPPAEGVVSLDKGNNAKLSSSEGSPMQPSVILRLHIKKNHTAFKNLRILINIWETEFFHFHTYAFFSLWFMYPTMRHVVKSNFHTKSFKVSLIWMRMRLYNLLILRLEYFPAQISGLLLFAPFMSFWMACNLCKNLNTIEMKISIFSPVARNSEWPLLW